MADEIIGSLGVQIEADASDLQGQYDAAVAESENAAERIAQAFESLIGIGEALAITEGLKEFGEEALNVFGTVQSVTIGLTQLTKSASDANEIIGQIKELANTEPFAFPDIAPTVQKMVALGVSTEQVSSVMQAAANAAAATGNSFDAVANSIDRMGLSGTVNARSLVQLGISTEDLGRAMGVTADQVKTAFAALDQSARIDAITAALDKFSGSAEAAAQGIAGQWQIFQNRFEEVMSGVGEALTPAITDILKFGDSAIHVAQEAIDAFNGLPEPVKEIAGAFAIAAAAIAPLAAGIGLLGQGLIGIQAVVGSVTTLLTSLGVISGTAAAEQTAEAAATVAQGTAAAVATPEVVALAVAETTAGQAASVSAIQLGLFGEAVEAETVFTSGAITQLGLFSEELGSISVATADSQVAVQGATFGFSAMDTAVKGASVAIAGLLVYDLASWADKNVPAIHSLGDEVYGLTQKVYDLSIGMPGAAEALTLWVTGALKPGAAAADQLSSATFLLSQKLGDLGIVIPRGTQSMDQWNVALQAAAANYQKTADAASGLGGGLDALVGKQEKLNEAEQQAAADLLIAKQAYADGKIGLDILTAAQDAYTKAVDAARSKSSDFKDTLAGITEAYNKQQGVINTLEQAQSQLLGVENRTADQENILTEISNKLATAKKAEAEAHNLVKIAIQGQGAAYEGLVTSADAFLKKETDVGQAVVYAKSVLDDLTARNDTSAAGQRALTDAVNQYATAMLKAGGALTDEITITVNGVQVVTTLGNAINQVKQSQGDWTSTVVNGVTVLKDHAAAVNNAASAHQNLNGVIITGQPIIKGYIDDTTKAIGYNQQFTGSVNDLGAAIGNTLTPNLNSASSSLSTLSLDAEQAQKSMQGLGSAAKTTGDEIDQAISAMDNWDSHLGSADATGLGAWTLAATLNGQTTFAGSGSAVNSQGQQVSALTELQAANQAAGVALANSLGLNTTATQTHTAAVTTNTTATVAATSAISASIAPVSTLATALDTTTTAAATFVDGLGNVYSSYQALVDAIKTNPLLAGPAQSQSGSGNLGSGPSTSSGSVVGPDGVTYASSYALYQAIEANPNILAHQGQTQDISFVGSQTGSRTTSNVSQSEFLNSLASLFPGSFSMQSAIGQTPGVPFGANPSSSSGPPTQIVMNYPQFNSQQQSNKVMSDMIANLRTVAGQKL